MTGEPGKAVPFVQESALIAAHETASERYYRLVLESPGVAARASPGQFVLLACRPDDRGETDPLLPRPMALLGATPQTGRIELLYYVAGRGTELLRQTAEEAVTGGRQTRLRLIGPLGNTFKPLAGVDAHVGVAGGSGVAPLAFLFRRWPGEARGERHLILGARTRGHLPRPDVVAAPGAQIHTATDDGSAGFAGHAAAALAALLDGSLRGRLTAIYAAGPEAMLREVVSLARRRDLPARISLEARMACGVGVCRGCVVDGRRPHPHTGLHRYAVCQDGPVFDPEELAGEWSAAR